MSGKLFLAAATAAASLAPAAAVRRAPSVRTPVIGRPVVNVACGKLAMMRFEAQSPAWSRDGKQIAFIESTGSGRAGNLWLATCGGATRRLTTGGADGAPAWTVDGRLVVAHVAGNRWSFQVVNTATGRTNPLVDGRTFPPVGRDMVPTSVTFSPDGAKVAFDVCKDDETVDDSGRVEILDLKSSKVQDLKTPDKSVTSHPSWSPDGRYIAYQRLPKGWYFNRSGDESYAQVWVTDLRTQTARQVTTPEKEINFVAPDWCPDGSFLAVEKWLVSMKRESRREAWMVNATNTASGAMLQDEGRNSGGVRWAPDGKHYAYIESRAVNGKFINELWVGAVSPNQRAAALKAVAATIATTMSAPR